MARKAILYIDLLGVQKMWGQGGPNKVKERVKEFNDFIIKQLDFLSEASHRDGEYNVILAGDSVSIITQDFTQAIGIGTHLFEQAFYATDKMKMPFWFRGAISAWNNQSLPYNTTSVKSKNIQVGTHYQYEDDYLKVIALEKSGFRGMRLIIDQSHLQNNGRDYIVKWPGFKRPLGTIVHLIECNYPKTGSFADILWMANTKNGWDIFCKIMAHRFKTCTHDQDEFIQASWTRATFDQVATLLWSCENKSAIKQNTNSCGKENLRHEIRK